MKVRQITPLKDKEGKDLWRIDFEGDDKAMWTGFSPTFSVGHTIEDDKIQLSKSGKSWIYKKKDSGATPTDPKREWKPKNDDDILLSVAFKGATECEGYWYVPEGKEQTKRLLENTAVLFAGLILLRPKKESK